MSLGPSLRKMEIEQARREERERLAQPGPCGHPRGAVVRGACCACEAATKATAQAHWSASQPHPVWDEVRAQGAREERAAVVAWLGELMGLWLDSPPETWTDTLRRAADVIERGEHRG